MYFVWKKTTVVTPQGNRELDTETVSKWLRRNDLKVTYNYDLKAWEITKSPVCKSLWDELEEHLPKELTEEPEMVDEDVKFLSWDETMSVIGLIVLINVLFWTGVYLGYIS